MGNLTNKLYKELASRILARHNCILHHNIEWEVKHTEIIKKLIAMLPHGSGLNYDWQLDFDKSSANNIILYMAYDTMDENGYYDGIVKFTLQIKPSLITDFDLHIRGNFGKYQDLKDYLYDTLNEGLNMEVRVFEDGGVIS